jgi:hypothetical protein
VPRKSGKPGSAGGRRKRPCPAGTSPAAYPTACTVRAGGLRKRTDGNVSTAPQADPTARPRGSAPPAFGLGAGPGRANAKARWTRRSPGRSTRGFRCPAGLVMRPAGTISDPAAGLGLWRPGLPALDPGSSGMPRPAGIPSRTGRQPDRARPVQVGQTVGCSTWTGRARPGRAEPARRDARTGRRRPPLGRNRRFRPSRTSRGRRYGSQCRCPGRHGCSSSAIVPYLVMRFLPVRGAVADTGRRRWGG